jgi:hypothetical protein
MRLDMISKVLLLTAACALTALGQETRMSGPVSGFVLHSPSHSIRPLLGVLGSAYLGPAITSDFDAASVSPLGKTALVTRGGKLFFLQGLDTGALTATPIDEAIPADRFAWGQDGVSAAIYSADSRQAQIIRNLAPARTPSIEAVLDLSTAEGDVSTLLFDGKRLLVGAGPVYLADASGLKLLLRTGNPAALALGAGNRDLFVADRDSNQIWMVSDYSGDATPMLFADDRAGLSTPVGLRVSAGGLRLLIANAGNSSVDALEISTRSSLKHIDLGFAPSRMDAVGSGALALLNSGADKEPLYLIDDGQDPAVYFVPAGSEE